MRLTNHLRECFIRAVANDIPAVKEPTIEQIKKEIRESITSEKLLALFDDVELQPYVKTQWVYVGSNCNKYMFTADVKVEELPCIVKFKKEGKARDAAVTKLRSLAYGCTTLKALHEAAPELRKYMAEEEGKKPTPGVPVPVGLLDDLKSVGFPKHEVKHESA